MRWIGSGAEQLGSLNDEQSTRNTVVAGVGAVQRHGSRLESKLKPGGDGDAKAAPPKGGASKATGGGAKNK